METTAFDPKDRAILRELQKDGRATIAAMAEKLFMSESALRRRIERLEEDGIIKSYSIDIDAAKLGFGLTVYVSISLNAQTEKDLGKFESAVRNSPEILECWLMTGESDYLLRVRARDVADLERIHREVLTRLPNVSRVNTAIAMRAVVNARSVAL